MEKSNRLALSYVMAGQAQKHVTVNETFRLLDALVQLTVLSASVLQQPTAPALGAAYILPVGKTGENWGGMADLAVAVFQDNAWTEIAAQTGLRAFVQDQGALVVFDGADWVTVSGGRSEVEPGNEVGGGPFAQLGINASADTTNRLFVKSDVELLSHDDVTPGSGDARKIINKAGFANTAAVLFQTNYQGHAALGLTGDNDLHVSISPDGNDFVEAFFVDHQTGKTHFKQPVTVLGGRVVRVVSTLLTLNVPEQFGTVQAAIDSLADVIFDAAGGAKIVVSDGTYVLSTTINCSHPQASNITVSASSPAVLSKNDFFGDKERDEEMLREKYLVIFDCVVQPILMSGIKVENILFINTSNSVFINGVSSDGKGDKITLNYCTFHGFRASFSLFLSGLRLFSSSGLVSSHSIASGAEIINQSFADLNGTLLMHSGGVGVNLQYGAFLTLQSGTVSGGANHGVDAAYNATLNITSTEFSDNAGRGVRVLGCSGYLNTCTIFRSASYAVECNTSYLRVQALTVDPASPAISRTVRAAVNGVIAATGTHTGNVLFSPAEGAGSGNSGSYIQ